MQYLHTTECHGNILPRGGLWGLPKVPSITRYGWDLGSSFQAVQKLYDETVTKLYSEKLYTTTSYTVKIYIQRQGYAMKKVT